MRDKRSVSMEVVSPSRGLITRIPSNQPSKMGVKGSFTVAENIRFDDGVVRNGPGYKRVEVFGVIEGDINLIVQDSLIQSNFPPFNSPFIGTSSKLYYITRDEYNDPDILPLGIATAEAFGNPAVSTPTVIVLVPTSIMTLENVNTISISSGVSVGGIASEESVSILLITLFIPSVGGIASAESVSDPTVT